MLQPPRIIARAHALFDYFGEEDVEDAQFLQFTQGTVVDVYERDESGWWEGALDGNGTCAPLARVCAGALMARVLTSDVLPCAV